MMSQAVIPVMRKQNWQHCLHLLRFRPARWRLAARTTSAAKPACSVWRGRWRVSLAPITSSRKLHHLGLIQTDITAGKLTDGTDGQHPAGIPR
ncbi:hypothetical protein KCP71_23245 [Salmonella enterica subsp. enterica]|nr:hypothetical protein KCP71_23245 [Salmonella enterica subsp. enterica]